MYNIVLTEEECAKRIAIAKKVGKRLTCGKPKNGNRRYNAIM